MSNSQHNATGLAEAADAPSHDAGETRRFIPALSGLRGLAAFMVLLVHSPMNDQWWARIGSGLAMSTFFILSAFLVTRNLMALERTGGSLCKFLVYRSLRLDPLYYLVILWCLVMARYDPERGRGIGWAVFYCVDVIWPLDWRVVDNTLGVAWSLGVEFKFYILWGIVWFYSGGGASRAERLKRIAAWAIAVPVAVAFLYSYWSHYLGDHRMLYFSFLFRLPELGAGCLLALNESVYRNNPSRSRACAARLLVAGLAVRGIPGLHPEVTDMYQSMLLGTGFVVGALTLHWTRSTFEPLLSNRIMLGLGAVSYGTYLFHGQVYRSWFAYCDEHGLLWQLKFYGGLAGTFALSIASYFTIERFFNSRRAQIYAWLTAIHRRFSGIRLKMKA